MKDTFEIDFFELAVLAEACVPPVPIARHSFWYRLIDVYYHELSKEQRRKLLDWIKMNPRFDLGDEDCLVLNARFDQNNQYEVTTNKDGETEVLLCFMLQGKYHITWDTSIIEEFIVSIKKIE